MSANSMLPALNTAANTNRGPSTSLWKGDRPCPWLDIVEDPSMGMAFFDDFLLCGQIPAATGGTSVTNMGQWGLYCSQGGLLTDGALEGGVISIGSDGDQESVTLASLAGAFRLVTTSTLALNQRLWFECRVAVGTIATTKNDCFIGLCDKLVTSNLMVNTIPISTTDDALSTTPNMIGFHRKSGVGTDWTFVYQLASGTAVYPTNLTTLSTTVYGSAITANGFVKLGFLFDPVADPVQITSASTGQTVGQIKRKLVRVFVNGLEAAAFLTSDNLGGGAFPTGFMGPVISNMQTATGANQLLVDWIRVAQLANS
jgi:hypothetical protein